MNGPLTSPLPKWFTVNETTSSQNLLPKQNHASLKKEKEAAEQRAHLAFNTRVPLIVFADKGMLSRC